MLKITVEGTSYDFDPSKMTNKEAKAIERFSGQRISTFQDSDMTTSDADQMTAIVWMCRTRAGEKDLAIDDVEFDMGSLEVVNLDDPTDVKLPDDPVDPTVLPVPSESGPVTG